jgi:transcription elongation factor Elf1
MGSCPTCGASSLFGVKTKQCAWCGKIVCNKCVPQWHGSLYIKEGAHYNVYGFCNEGCYNSFWSKVFVDYPLHNIGTNIEGFDKELVSMWNKAILYAIKSSNPAVVKSLSQKAIDAIAMHNAISVAFPLVTSSGQTSPEFDKFYANSKKALAENLEKCGRTQDAAKVFEELRLYDKARGLREKDRQLVIKKTDVSVNLNALLQQVKDGGIVAIFRCPHCGGKLKISDKTTLNSLRICEHCGSEIEAIDLADFLKTVLS